MTPAESEHSPEWYASRTWLDHSLPYYALPEHSRPGDWLANTRMPRLLDQKLASQFPFQLGPQGLFVTRPDLPPELLCPQGILFLGYVFPYYHLQEWVAQNPVPAVTKMDPAWLAFSIDSMCRGEAVDYEGGGGEPDDHGLSMILKIGAPGARALYLYCHHHLAQRAESGELDPRWARALQSERMLYKRADDAWLKRHVWPRIMKDRADSGIEHWYWLNQEQLQKMRPDVAWRSVVDVPVHRLLWPVARPAEILFPNRKLRKTTMCPDTSFRNCVNPAHFEWAVRMTDRRDIPPGLQNRGRSPYTRYMHPWVDSPDFVWLDTDQSSGRPMMMVHCPQGHQFPPRVQDNYWMWSNPEHPRYRTNPGTTSKCNRCFERYEAEVGRESDGKIKPRPRKKRVVNTVAEDLSYNDFEHGFLNSEFMRELRNKPEQ